MGNIICFKVESSAIHTVTVDESTKNIQPIQKSNTQTSLKHSNEIIPSPSISQQEQNDKICQMCTKTISFTFVQINCQKNCLYHPICIEEHIKKLIDSEKQIIKCGCGTKINTNFLRLSSIPGKMNLLSKIFERQLDYILGSSQQIRRDIEIQNYVKQNRQRKEYGDYILIQQDTLIYEETPQ
ncbi:unnamed protein product [Paramecium pentaurelia]|uniref:RING-type domain-containing protein n=1 Tax=Paramecium pentaurelia TaxID=43138 RepID=A0A8S1V989_9CILI|nr:unnamed protein product [Paramecium pentaurelia]